MWVRSEYAGELAVLSAWLCALLPWSVSYASQGSDRLVRIHFLYAFFQFAPGSGLANFLDTTVLLPEAVSFADNASVSFGYQLWALGAIVVTGALALSVTYYRLDIRLERRSPVDPVRVMGLLLVAAAVPLAAATYFVHSGSVGVTIPVGVPFTLVLGGLLLVVERTGGGPGAGGAARVEDGPDAVEDGAAAVDDGDSDAVDDAPDAFEDAPAAVEDNPDAVGDNPDALGDDADGSVPDGSRETAAPDATE
jgi:uncharacterized protein (TIGR04206 family)